MFSPGRLSKPLRADFLPVRLPPDHKNPANGQLEQGAAGAAEDDPPPRELRSFRWRADADDNQMKRRRPPTSVSGAAAAPHACRRAWCSARAAPRASGRSRRRGDAARRRRRSGRARTASSPGRPGSVGVPPARRAPGSAGPGRSRRPSRSTDSRPASVPGSVEGLSPPARTRRPRCVAGVASVHQARALPVSPCASSARARPPSVVHGCRVNSSLQARLGRSDSRMCSSVLRCGGRAR